MTPKAEVTVFPPPVPKCQHGVAMVEVCRFRQAPKWEPSPICAGCAEIDEAYEEDADRWVDALKARKVES